jgi:hypothetical protein
MITLANAFLTGIANAYVKYDVTRTLAYGFSFDTKTLSELLKGVFSFFK